LQVLREQKIYVLGDETSLERIVGGSADAGVST